MKVPYGITPYSLYKLLQKQNLDIFTSLNVQKKMTYCTLLYFAIFSLGSREMSNKYIGISKQQQTNNNNNNSNEIMIILHSFYDY